MTRETKRRQKIYDDVIPESCDVIVIFLIYGQFGAIRKPDSGYIVCKLIPSLIRTFYLIKTENRTVKFLTQLSQYCFEKGTIFAKKTLIFCKKNADINKIKRTFVLKVVFSQTAYVFVLTCEI